MNDKLENATTTLAITGGEPPAIHAKTSAYRNIFKITPRTVKDLK